MNGAGLVSAAVAGGISYLLMRKEKMFVQEKERKGRCISYGNGNIGNTGNGGNRRQRFPDRDIPMIDQVYEALQMERKAQKEVSTEEKKRQVLADLSKSMRIFGEAH